MPAEGRAATATLPPPGGRRTSSALPWVGALGVVMVTVAAGVLAWHFTDDPDSSAAPTTTGPAEAAAPRDGATAHGDDGAAAETGAEKKAGAAGDDEASEDDTEASEVGSDGGTTEGEDTGSGLDGLAGCYADLLPADAFGDRDPDLSATCEGKSAYRTMLALKTEIVRTGGPTNVTDAMGEWSRLGWHETAAFAIMRAHCCPDAPALQVPPRFARCRMEAALAYLANALDDEAEMEEALDDYAEAARCVALSGGGGAFGKMGLPTDAEVASVKKILGRIDEH